MPSTFFEKHVDEEQSIDHESSYSSAKSNPPRCPAFCVQLSLECRVVSAALVTALPAAPRPRVLLCLSVHLLLCLCTRLLCLCIRQHTHSRMHARAHTHKTGGRQRQDRHMPRFII